MRTLRRNPLLVAALTAGLVVTAAPAAGQEVAPPNHREVPNAACGSDIPTAAFPDRGEAVATHRRNVDCVAHLGIAEGSGGRYLPAGTVTRGQMASFVARTLEAAGHQLPPPQGQGFRDIDNSVHRDRIRQLARIGVVEGRSQDRYEPGGTVSRAQMASYLVRAASWAHDHVYRPVGDDAYFLDITGNVHSEAIRGGFELFLFEGRRPGEYVPDDAVRRDVMATFLARALDLVHTGDRQSSHQTYLVAPQEPLSGAPGSELEFSVLARYGGDADGVRQSLHVALFPCARVGTDQLPATFADADGNGIADGRGATDAQTAEIASVNGQAQPAGTRFVASVTPGADGRISFTLGSAGPDCAVPVVWDDRPPVDELRVDATGLAANPYGIGLASWR